MQVKAQRTHTAGAMLVCMVFSLLLHGCALLWLSGILSHNSHSARQNKANAGPAPQAAKMRHVQVIRPVSTPQRQDVPPPKQEQPPRQAPFAKTSADTPQALPDKSDYVGARNTRASGDPHAYRNEDDKEQPTQEGEEKEELVTFDQERQDGPLEHEGVKEPHSSPASPDTAQTLSSAQEGTPPKGIATGAPHTPDTEGDAAQEWQAEGSLTLNAAVLHQSGHLRPLNTNPHTADKESRAARLGEDFPEPKTQAPTQGQKAAQRAVLYDPSLAQGAEAQGFRTTERRTRSSGKFVLGRGAALNVSATPRGQYEALIYRSIARHWYVACDQHRGDIIPGKINISLRINRKGRLVNMQLQHRRGASISQQSFTFNAIRQAELPPMPPAVQQEVVGELMELIFEFNFD